MFVPTLQSVGGCNLSPTAEEPCCQSVGGQSMFSQCGRRWTTGWLLFHCCKIHSTRGPLSERFTVKKEGADQSENLISLLDVAESCSVIGALLTSGIKVNRSFLDTLCLSVVRPLTKSGLRQKWLFSNLFRGSASVTSTRLPSTEFYCLGWLTV